MATTLDVPVGPKKEKAKRRSRRGNPSHGGEYPLFRRQAMPQ